LIFKKETRKVGCMQTHDAQREIIIQALGTPRPQPRPRFAGGHKNEAGETVDQRVISTVDPKAKRWASEVERQGRNAVANLGGEKVIREILGAGPRGARAPLEFIALFCIPTKEKNRWGLDHDQVPDTDNLAKLAMDALMRSGVMAGDDGRVSRLVVEKIWCPPSEAGATFRIKQRAKRAKVSFGSSKPDWIAE
jgi:hypothetical protein